MRYVWLVYEEGKFKEYLFGIFSSEELAIKACREEFSKEGTPNYRMEKHRLDPQ